jgi:hypothetical protein
MFNAICGGHTYENYAVDLLDLALICRRSLDATSSKLVLELYDFLTMIPASINSVRRFSGIARQLFRRAS